MKRKTVCKSCGQPILFATTGQGRPMPVDAEPAEDGTVALSAGPTGLRAHVLAPGEDPGSRPRHTPHWATCPDADIWRADQPRPAGPPGPATGPCARCQRPTHVYGPGGNPLCPDCQDKLAEWKAAEQARQRAEGLWPQGQ